MRFYEKKTKKGFNYQCEDVFGKIEMDSPDKLDSEQLDSLFMAIFEHESRKKTVEGKVKDTEITYKYTKKNQWEKLKKFTK
jgi:hypothetical protein